MEIVIVRFKYDDITTTCNDWIYLEFKDNKYKINKAIKHENIGVLLIITSNK